MSNWIPKPGEFIHKSIEHAFYGVVCGALAWLFTLMWAAIDGWSPLAVWIGSLAVGAFVTTIYVGARLVMDQSAKASQAARYKIQLSFDRNAIENFWYTFDADDNRNITRHAEKRRFSMSIFAVTPVIFPTYDLTIHGADLFAYNGHSERWEALEPRMQAGFPGPNVERDALKFQQQRPAFQECSIEANSSKKASIPSIGAFADALSSEFTVKPTRWGSSEIGSYVCVAVILHVHTRYLFFTCLLPEMSANSRDPAYFLGTPDLADSNDKTFFRQRAESNLRNLGTLGVAERVEVLGVIR